MEKEKSSKNARKTIPLAIILALLIGVLTFGSVALAKYLTTESVDSQKAKIAKWGFEIAVDADNLFGIVYNNSTEVSLGEESIVVKADSEDTKLVAPGTSGSMTFSIGGTAEVFSKLTLSVSENFRDVVLVEGTDSPNSQSYYPVKWTLKKDDVSLLADVTLGEIVEKLQSFNQNVIQIGKEPDCAGKYTIEWKWEFNSNVENNRKDTILGQIADGATVENCNANTDIMFELVIGIEQIKAPQTPNV